MVEVLNDGRADFAANPLNGPTPTYERGLSAGTVRRRSRLARSAAWKATGYAGNAPCLLRGNGELKQPPPYNINSSWQTSIGFERQLGTVMVLEADYVFTKSRNEGWEDLNVNIAYNPRDRRQLSEFESQPSAVPRLRRRGDDRAECAIDYHGVQTSLTKRMSHHWQAAGDVYAQRLVGRARRAVQGVPGRRRSR